MKQILILVAMMLIMVGPSVALNPQYEIPLSSCSDESADGLLFDRYTYDAGYRVWEMDVTVNGLEFGINEDGTIQYLGEPLDEYAERTITYYIYKVDEFGNIISGTYEGHNVGVNIDPCVIEAPSCEYRFSDFDDNIQIGTPTIGQTVPVSWSAPGGNGDWSLRIYEAGVLNRGKWTGNYPIEVVASELYEDWQPTGFQIIDGICEA